MNESSFSYLKIGTDRSLDQPKNLIAMKNSSLISSLKKGIILSGLLISCQFVQSQPEDRSKVVLTVNNTLQVNGNGFGFRYLPSVGMNINNSIEIWAGPSLKASKPYLTGFCAGYSQTLLKPENSFSGRTSLKYFVTFERSVKQYFSKNQNELEQFIGRRAGYENYDFKQIRFKGYDMTAGFVIGHHFDTKKSIHFDFGISVYGNKKTNHQDLKLYYQNKGMVLSFGISFRCLIFKEKNKE